MSALPSPSPDTALRLLQAVYREALAPVTEQLFASARIAPGQRVLDVGSGAGDTAVLAAERVGAAGFVLATDASPEVVQSLVERLGTLGSGHRVAAEMATAEQLALQPGSFDVALARNCVMYFRDLPRACRNLHLAMRPGGRFVASVYGPLEREPFHSIPIAAVRRRREVRAPYPDYVQAFRVGADAVERALRGAGFAWVERHAVVVGRTFQSVEYAIATLRHSRSLAELLSQLPSSEIDDAWIDIAVGFREYESAAGLHLPGEQIVLTAVK
ncbi:MAG: methyltransferase domain-containing protein [Steroidobacteraceae bacterium]|nr:methyltransferase domain-containing protein [Steroidobacteraceae bacterium]